MLCGTALKKKKSNECACVLLLAAAAAAKSLQSCPTLCDPRDRSPSGSPVPGILQARTLEWVAISFSNAWKWKVKGKSLSRVQLFGLWPTRLFCPLEFSRQEYWSGLPFPTPGDLHNAGIELLPLISCALAGKFFTTEPPGKPNLVNRLSQSS